MLFQVISSSCHYHHLLLTAIFQLDPISQFPLVFFSTSSGRAHAPFSSQPFYSQLPLYFVAITSVLNLRILLERSFIAHMLLVAASRHIWVKEKMLEFSFGISGTVFVGPLSPSQQYQGTDRNRLVPFLLLVQYKITGIFSYFSRCYALSNSSDAVALSESCWQPCERKRWKAGSGAHT